MKIHSLTTNIESRLSELRLSRGYPNNACHEIIPIVATKKKRLNELELHAYAKHQANYRGPREIYVTVTLDS